MYRWFGIALLAFSPVLLAQTSKTLQTPQTTGTPQTTLHVSTSRVLLDFVVRDKHGQIIHNLKPSEVRVFENGVPQTVRHFEFFNGKTETSEVLTATAATAPKTIAAEPSTQSLPPKTVNNLREINVVTIVIANLDPRGRKIALNAMHEFIKDDLTPNTYVGVLGLGAAGLDFVQPYTNNGQIIAKAVAKITSSAFVSKMGMTSKYGLPGVEPIGKPVQLSPSGAAGEEAALDTSWTNAMHDLYTGSMNILGPLRLLVQEQRQIPGRKVILVFAAGLPIQNNTVDLLRSIISVANRSNVSFYTLDTRGLRPETELAINVAELKAAANASRQQQLAMVSGGSMAVTPAEVMAPEMAVDSIFANQRGNLRDLAESTGGQLLPDSLDMRDTLQRVMQGMREHYELTYSPTNTAIDGTFRHVQIKVSRPGVRVFAPKGYYALPFINEREIYPFEMATLKALHTRPAPHQVEFHAAVLRFHPGATEDQMAFVFQVPTKDITVTTDRQRAKVHVSVTTLIKNSKGKIVQKISNDIPYSVSLSKKAALEKGIVTFTAPFLLAPGHYTVETAMVDRESGKASVHRWTVDVPPIQGFAMSGVSLVRRVDPIRGRANPLDPFQAHGATVTPELGNTLSPFAKGTLRFYAVAYPPAPIDAPVFLSVVLSRNGKPVMWSPPSPVQLDPQGAAPILARFPAAKLQPGHYSAQVSFEYKGKTLTKKTTFILHKHS